MHSISSKYDESAQVRGRGVFCPGTHFVLLQRRARQQRTLSERTRTTPNWTPAYRYTRYRCVNCTVAPQAHHTSSPVQTVRHQTNAATQQGNATRSLVIVRTRSHPSPRWGPAEFGIQAVVVREAYAYELTSTYRLHSQIVIHTFSTSAPNSFVVFLFLLLFFFFSLSQRCRRSVLPR